LPGFPGFTENATTTAYALEEANTLLDGVSTRITAEEYRALRREALSAEFASSTTSTAFDAASGTPDALIDARLAEEVNSAQVFYRKDKQGEILELTLVTADTPEYKQAAELIAGFWQDIGIKTMIQRVAAKEISRLALKPRDYDVLLYGLILGGDPDQFPFWHSSQIDFPGLNLSRYVNRTADGFLERARETADMDEAAEMYRKFEAVIREDRPAIFLYSPTYTYATSDRIFGIAAARIFHPSDRLNGVAQWYMKTDSTWQPTQ
jgi:ABC-type transport system substrate-binding protein